VPGYKGEQEHCLAIGITRKLEGEGVCHHYA